MKCPSCYMEIPDNSSFCNHCGRSVDRFELQDSVPDNNTNNATSDIKSADSISNEIHTDFQHPNFIIPDKIKRFLALIPIFIIIVWCIVETARPRYVVSRVPASVEPASLEEEQTDDNTFSEQYTKDYDYYANDNEYVFKYQAVLTCGFYVPGVNIPAGLYTLKRVYGHGNVYSNKLDKVFGPNTNPCYIEQYDNLLLDDSDCLVIRGNAAILVTTTRAIKEQRKISNLAKKRYKFSTGTYKCGKDIKKGTYDIIYVNGSGLVYIPYKLDENFGPNLSLSELKKAKNISLSPGDEISITGCTVRFAPSKGKFEKNIY